MIEASGLSKYYGSFVAVEDISFSIPQGQVVAFLGPNGAGKTTMMRMLTGYLGPSAGEAAIAGHDVRRDRIAASHCFGYLPENGPMYPDMTPLELLRFFGEVRQMAPARLKDRIDAVVDLCALGLVTEKPIGKLSRGYRQRVGMAQALLHDPDVLIMDEPTAGLDPNQIRKFRQGIEELRKTKTLLISTHILHEAEAIADRVLLIDRGSLLRNEPVAQLKKNGSLEELFYRLTGDDAEKDGAAGAAAGASESEAQTVESEGGAAEDADEKVRSVAENAGTAGAAEPPARAAADADDGGATEQDVSVTGGGEANAAAEGVEAAAEDAAAPPAQDAEETGGDAPGESSSKA